MRNILGLLLILVIAFTSCEGRKTQNQALSESIEEFNKKVTLQVEVYEPETCVEQEVDTLFSNGFHIKIKAYTDMTNSVLFTKIKDTINYQTYYRQFKINVLVEKEGKEIYKQEFNKSMMNTELGYLPNLNSGSPIYNFYKHAVLKSIQIDEELSTEDAVFIDIAYAIPNQDYIDWQKLKIDKSGKAIFTSI